MAEFTQEHRTLQLATPLGKDVLLLEGFRGEESVSDLFRFDLECVSEKPDLDFDAIIGKNVTVSMRGLDSTRFANGIVSRFRQGITSLHLTSYYIEVVPWLWFLTRTSDCRIHQEKTVPEIISSIFDELGFEDYTLDLHESYEPCEYRVQYQETHFDFVSRLMEGEGIRYYFQHEDGKHTLVLADSAGNVKPCPDRPEARFNPERNAVHKDEIVFGLSHEKSVHSTSVAMRDFNFETPRDIVDAKREFSAKFGKLNLYEYPGAGANTSEGSRNAGLRLEEEAARREVVQGASLCYAFSPGYKFDLKEHPRGDYNQSLLLLKLSHEAKEGSFQPGRHPAGEYSYENRFEAIPSSTPFRPERATPGPVMQGAQTAVVTGPKGEEIHTDKYGRIKVQFHWDREGKLDDKSSCWVRVAQGWAGKNWGTMFLPRIGQEVIVEFLEGDPDSPIITGCVYNAEAMPPYVLPANKTMSGIKSRSSKDAKPENLNTIRFEDKMGEEQIFVQAERNQDVRVKNDRFEFIGNDRHLQVKKDKQEHVENDRSEKVDRDHKEQIGRDRNLKVSGKEAIEVSKSRSIKVADDVIEEFKKNHSEQVTKDYYLKAKNIVIEATENVTIKVGQSFIAIESGGIKLGTDGEIVLDAKKDITQKSTLNIKIEAKAKGTVKGTGGLSIESAAVTDVKGASTLKLSGGLVKLN